MSDAKRSLPPQILVTVLFLSVLALGCAGSSDATDAPAAPEADNAGESSTNAAPGGNHAAASGDRDAVESPPAKQAQSPSRQPDAKPPQEVLAKAPPKLAASTPPQAVEESPPQKEEVAAAPAGPVDLLKLIDPKKHALVGDWRFEKGVLVASTNQIGSRLHVPYQLPAEYDIHATVTVVPSKKVLRNSNIKHPAVTFGLAGGGRPVTVKIDFRAQRSYFRLLKDVKRAQQSGMSMKGRLLKDGVPANLVYQVRKAGVTVLLNKRTILYWRGDFSEFEPSVSLLGAKQSGPAPLLIGGGIAPIRFSKLTLQLPKSPGSANDSPVETVKTPVENRPMSPANLRPAVVDLLESIDPQQASISGKWSMRFGALLSPVGRNPKVKITDKLPAEYDLRMTVVRLSGKGCLFVGLPMMGGHVPCYIDDDVDNGEPLTGLGNADGSSGPEKSRGAYSGHVLEKNVPGEFVISVRKGSIAIKRGAKEIFRWKGDAAKFRTHNAWAIADKAALYLGAANTRFRMTFIDLVDRTR